jgi:hypothetical protein
MMTVLPFPSARVAAARTDVLASGGHVDTGERAKRTSGACVGRPLPSGEGAGR